MYTTSIMIEKKDEATVGLSMVKDERPECLDITVTIRKSMIPGRVFVKVEYLNPDGDPRWKAETQYEDFERLAQIFVKTKVGRLLVNVSQGKEHYFISATW